MPLIPDSVLKIAPNTNANISQYFKDTKPQITTLVKALSEVLKTDAEKIDDLEVQNDLQTSVAALANVFESLPRVSVPQKYLELHKNLLITVYSLQKIAEAMIDSNQDPLKSLLIMNQSDQAGEFWRDTLLEYEKASKAK